jgi:glycosyltransferase involved in cell wall biosynthesis
MSSSKRVANTLHDAAGRRADLHIHSRYSDRPQEWILRRLGTPESYVDPGDLYDRCRERGMDFVTITDRNTIAGCLEISDRPGVFLSSEVTSYFPENRAKVHVLVWGVTPSEFEDIQRLRENIFDLSHYLHATGTAAAVSHALDRPNGKLTVGQFEQLLLLFKRFELINGSRDPRNASILGAVLSNLTPTLIHDLAERHDVDPLGIQPWRKWTTGGSDDHAGPYAATAWTETPDCATVEEFLDHLRNGHHEAGGESGNSLRLAHGFYTLAYQFYQSRLTRSTRRDLIGELFKRLLQRPEPKPAPGVIGSAWGYVKRMAIDYHKASLSGTERLLIEEFGALFAQDSQAQQSSDETAPALRDDERTFQLASRIADQLSYAFFREFMTHVMRGNLLESLQAFLSLAPVAMAVAPYLAAFHSQHRDEPFRRDVARKFAGARKFALKTGRRAWVTDTFGDLNGVSHTIRTLAGLAAEQDRELVVLTCLDETPDVPFPLKNFVPIGSCPLPEYEHQTIACPPILEVIEYLEREQFDEVIISTPGPLGMLALLAAKLLGLPTVGIYHTDFPRYVGNLTEDALLEQLTWQFMLWFYRRTDLVFAPSSAYRDELAERGVPVDRLRVMRRGIDQELFHPERRDEQFWSRWNREPAFTYLYVGRISKEKRVEQLLETFLALPVDTDQPMQLVIVGDGPLRSEMERQTTDPRVLFTGILRGEELATAYASADAFVFPSTTDTFGNVVLEAQASGLPAIVSHRGGPQEIVSRYRSGMVVDVNQPGRLAAAMLKLRDEPDTLRIFRERALWNARQSTWQKSLDALWTKHSDEDAPLPERLASEEDALSLI